MNEIPRFVLEAGVAWLLGCFLAWLRAVQRRAISRS